MNKAFSLLILLLTGSFSLLQAQFLEKRELQSIRKAQMLFENYRSGFGATIPATTSQFNVSRKSETISVGTIPRQPDGETAFFESETGLWIWKATERAPFPDRFVTIASSTSDIQTWILPSENAGLEEDVWMMALVHEQFHQLQISQPNYFSTLDTLAANAGDTSGCWIHSHVFPFEQTSVQQALDGFRAAVLVDLQNGAGMRNTRAAILEIEDALSESDFAYFNAMIWLEGFAKYSEWEVLNQITQAKSGKTSFSKNYQAKLARMLINPAKAIEGNAFFYQIGIPLGTLMQRELADWKMSYLKTPFDITKLIQQPRFSHNRVR